MSQLPIPDLAPVAYRIAHPPAAIRGLRGFCYLGGCWLPGGDCRADAVAMVRAQGFESHLPAVAQLRVTPGGEIWVQRGHLGDEAAVIDIWAADGR